MDISWLGHACVRIRTSNGMVVMDPVDRASGFDMGRPSADIVTVSRSEPAHSNVRGLRGDPVVLNAPGEYEVRGVQLLGIASRDPEPPEGVAPESNTVFVLEAEDLRVAHLGGLGWTLGSEQAEHIGSVDVLIVPVGEPALAPAEAARLVRELEPTIVIPVHYTPDAQDRPPADFVQALGTEPEEPTQRISVQRRGLGETTRLVLLTPRG